MSDKKPRINSPILLDFEGYKDHFIYSIPDGAIKKVDGKIMLRGFARDVKDLGHTIFGHPKPDIEEMKKPRELVFWEQQLIPFAEGELSQNRQIYIALPLTEDMESPIFKKSPIFKLIAQERMEIDYLLTHISNMNNAMQQLRNMTLAFSGGEMTDAQLNQVQNYLDSLMKFNNQVVNRYNPNQQQQPDKGMLK
jgi:hypothetical protein